MANTESYSRGANDCGAPYDSRDADYWIIRPWNADRDDDGLFITITLFPGDDVGNKHINTNICN